MVVTGIGWNRLAGLGLDVDPARGGAMIVGNAQSLLLADESVDLVLLWRVLEHIPQPWMALKELSRVLKRGG